MDLAADFESSNYEYLSISDATQNGLDITGSLTLVGCMKPESLERYQILAAKYEYGVNNRAYRLDLRPGNRLMFIVSPDGGFSYDYALEANPAFTLSAGAWYHAAGVFDAEQRSLAIYLDGDLIASRLVSYGTIYNSSAPFMLGAVLNNSSATQHFDGRLDEWRVYSRALTETEIENLMATPTPMPADTLTPTPTEAVALMPTSTDTLTPTPTEEPTPTETAT